MDTGRIRIIVWHEVCHAVNGIDQIASAEQCMEWMLVISKKTGLYSTGLDLTLLYFTLLYSTLLYFTLLYFTLLYSTLLCFTLRYSTLLYFTLLYSHSTSGGITTLKM